MNDYEKEIYEICSILRGINVGGKNVVKHLYVYFLDNSPEQSLIDTVCKEYLGPDTLRAGKREVYLLFHQSIRNSKLAARTAKIFDSATARDWKTINKLYDMLTTL